MLYIFCLTPFVFVNTFASFIGLYEKHGLPCAFYGLLSNLGENLDNISTQFWIPNKFSGSLSLYHYICSSVQYEFAIIVCVIIICFRISFVTTLKLWLFDKKCVGAIAQGSDTCLVQNTFCRWLA